MSQRSAVNLNLYVAPIYCCATYCYDVNELNHNQTKEEAEGSAVEHIQCDRSEQMDGRINLFMKDAFRNISTEL